MAAEALEWGADLVVCPLVQRGLREHPLADAADPPSQLAEPERARLERDAVDQVPAPIWTNVQVEAEQGDDPVYVHEQDRSLLRFWFQGFVKG